MHKGHRATGREDRDKYSDGWREGGKGVRRQKKTKEDKLMGSDGENQKIELDMAEQ